MSLQEKLLVLLPDAPKWSLDDGGVLRAFLLTPSGQSFMRNLLYSRPVVSGTDAEARRIHSDERAGFEACMQEILTLAEAPAS